MEANENTIKLYYNTEVEKLAMPEYGRNILKMVEQMKAIENRAKRSEQARAIVKVMETLNPQVHQQENFEQKLWDHLYMIAGYDLDIDAPYPAPQPEVINSRPETIPLNTKPIKARHYGRNIESIIDLIATEPDGEGEDGDDPLPGHLHAPAVPDLEQGYRGRPDHLRRYRAPFRRTGKSP